MVLSILLSVLAAAPAPAAGTDPSMPHLRRQGTAVPPIVDGKPFLVRGHQGRHVRLEPGRFSIQRVTLYLYQGSGDRADARRSLDTHAIGA